MLLALVLAFPCLLRIAFNVLAFGAFVITVACAASWAGEFFSDSLSCPCPAKSKPTTKPSCCRTTAPPCAKQTAAPSAPPDHSSVSVKGSESSLTIVVSAPGVATNNLDVKLQPGEPPVLTIKGESTVAGTRRGVNRTIMLPRDVNIDEASATHADGILTLTLPKKVMPAKQIKIEKAVPKATPARCSPTRKAAVLAQIRDGVQLKKTPGPQPYVPNEPKKTPGRQPFDAAWEAMRASEAYVSPTQMAEAQEGSMVDIRPLNPLMERIEKMRALEELNEQQTESDDEGAQWEVVKELAENIDAAILQELADMGFEDTALNTALLEKHAGSVNATVKELVARRRAAVKSDKEAAAIAEAAG